MDTDDRRIPTLARLLIAAAALRLPPGARAGWRREWEAELWHEVRREGGGRWAAVRAALGAPADAGALAGVLRTERRNGEPRDGRTTMGERAARWIRELKQAARSLLREPGFTLVAVATLALGMGGATAIFTLLQRAVLDPLPYPESERLVRLKNVVSSMQDGEWNWATAQHLFYSEHARTIEEIGAFRLDGAVVEAPEGAILTTLVMIDAGGMRLIGGRAGHGRVIDDPADAPGAPAVVVLSDGFWRRAFGADPGVVGRVLQVHGQPHEVIGVLEPGVALPQEPGAPAGLVPDLWTPFRIDPARPSHSHIFPMIARLAPGATAADATAELRALLPRLAEATPDGTYGPDFVDRLGFSPVAYDLREYVVGGLAESLWVLLGAVGLVLLVAAANAGNLFLVRMEDRRRELAVRSALGAGRPGILRYLLAEAAVLAFAAGAMAALVAYWGIPLLASLAPDTLPRIHRVRLDGSGVLFAMGMAGGVALLLALLPMARLRGRHAGGLGDTLSGGGRPASPGRDRQLLRSALVVGQVALALTLVVGAGLLLRSVQALRAVDPGIEAGGVVTATVPLSGARYRDSADRWRFYRAFLEEARALPGVTAAGLGNQRPVADSYSCTAQGFGDPAVYERLRAAELTGCAGQAVVTPGYFEALGIPLLRGRTFAAADNDDPSGRAVVVSRAFADRFWPGEDALGKRVAPNGWRDPLWTVVGVVGDVKAGALDGPDAIAIYYPAVGTPMIDQWWSANYLFLRTDGGGLDGLVQQVDGILAGLDPSVPLANVERMETVLARSASRLTFTTILLQIAAAMALLLAAVGLYGVVAYVVSQRTREIGVRMAVGARRSEVIGLILRQALGLVFLGAALGTVLSMSGGRLLESLLFGVEPGQPPVLAGAVAVLGLVAAAAAVIPSWRAATVDPSEALRMD